jgi:hypothetical protein
MNEATTYFINPSGGNGDYHLIDTSSAVDAGSSFNAPNIDKDGITRPQGSGFDIGAYEYNTNTSVEETISPADFILFQNYPNPFNPSTRISWQSSVGGWQILKVFDVLGNEIATLVNEYKDAGSYEVDFNMVSSVKNPVSGIYFYQLVLGNFSQTKKMLMIK